MGNIYEEYEPPVSQGLYHTFEDNKTYTFRIVSEPVVFISTFKDNDSIKYAWLVWSFDTKSVQVLQLPKTGYKALAKFGKDPEYGDPQEYNIRVTRTGKGFDTKYDVIASPKKQKLGELISQEDFEKILDVDLLESVRKGKGVSNANWLKDAKDGDGATAAAENKNTADAEAPAAPPADKPAPTEEPW